MTAKVGIVLLAAGSSSRMNGGDKTLELIDGMTLLERLVRECIASSAFQTTLVLPPNRPDRVAAIKHLEVQTVIAEDAQLGMSASIKAGIKALHGVEAALIVLADMPEITRAHLELIMSAFHENQSRTIIRATDADGTVGHPVLFARQHFDALQNLSGDQGAKQLLKSNTVHKVMLNGHAATTDLDTPEAWQEWRASKRLS